MNIGDVVYLREDSKWKAEPCNPKAGSMHQILGVIISIDFDHRSGLPVEVRWDNDHVNRYYYLDLERVDSHEHKE